MASEKFLHINPGINLVPQTTTAVSVPGDIDYSTDTGKFNFYGGGGFSPAVTENGVQTLTNKTISATTNTITNLTNTNLNGAAAISNANLAAMASHTVKGNNTGGSAVPSDLTLGTVTESTSSVLTLSGWANATVGSPTIRVLQSSAIQDGYLSAADWTTFNNKGSFSGLNTDGVIYAASSSTVASTTVGTAGQVLTSNGAGVAPTFQNGAVTGANTALSNLAATSINQSLVPNATNTFNLGTLANAWGNVTSVTFNLVNSGGTNLASLISNGTNLVTLTAKPTGTALTLTTTAEASTTQNTGALNVTTGTQTAGGNSGDITVQPGTVSGGGIQGNIKLSSTQGLTIDQISTPANPASNKNKIYFKSGNGLYILNSAGVESQVITAATAFQFFASSVVTTASSDITGTSFATFSNSPAFTFTPTVTGTYKVYGAVPLLQGTGGVQGFCKIINTSGGATLLYESQGTNFPAILSSVFTQSVYTLTASVSYVFDIQGKNSSTGTLSMDALGSSFYMFAELCG